MIRSALALVVAFVFPATAAAQERVHVIPGLNGYLTGITDPAADGTRYVGGAFSAFNAIGARGSAVVSADTGDVDKRFPQVVGDDVYLNDANVKVAVPDGSGGWYIGGNFEAVDDSRIFNAAHIRSDGSLDLDWRPNPDEKVRAIAVSGSMVYLGGNFTKVSGATRKGIAAIGTDGRLAAWNPRLNGVVATIAVAGKTVFFGGGFTKVGQVSRRTVAAVGTDGSVKPWNPAPSLMSKRGKTSISTPGSVLSLVVSGSVVYLGGWFDRVLGRGRKNLAAVGIDGTLQPWNPGANFAVEALRATGSDVYVGGPFTEVAGRPRFGAAKVGADGSLSKWDPALGGCPYEWTCEVTSIALRDGVIYLAGDYRSAAGKPRKGIAAFDDSGKLLDWNPNPHGGDHSSLVAESESGLYLAGDFTSIGGDSRRGLAALDGEGRLLPWNPKLQIETTTSDMIGGPSVTSIALAGSAVYIGLATAFEGADGVVRSGAAAVGTDGRLLPWHPAFDSAVSGLAVVGSTVYMGGEFSEVNGRARSYAAAVNTDGRLLPWNPRVSDDPSYGNAGIISNGVSQVLASGSKLYLAGDFAKVGGKARRGFAAVDRDGTVTDWDPRALGAWDARDKERTVRWDSSLDVVGSTVYLAGDFAQVQGKARNGIAAVGTDGKLLGWNPKFEGGEPDSVRANDSTIYVGGSFTKVNGQSRNGLASFGSDGSLTSWAPFLRDFPDDPGVSSGSAPQPGFNVGEGASSSVFGSSASDRGVFVSCGEGTIEGRSCDGFFSVRPDGILDQLGVALAGDVAPTLTVPTAPSITGRPPRRTTATSAQFSIAADAGDRVTCGMDGGTLYLCGESKSYTGLKPGPHVFCVRVVNAAGVENVVTWNWTVTKPKPAARAAGA